MAALVITVVCAVGGLGYLVADWWRARVGKKRVQRHARCKGIAYSIARAAAGWL